MIDHLVGNPSPSWRRSQVFLVIFFWIWRIVRGNPSGPFAWIRRINRRAAKRLTPWQLVASSLTAVYAIRNFDKILGLPAPEPLAGVYSPSFYRATWITTGLDAGFATAMSIRPKWLKGICSMIFSIYYIIYAHEADEKLRKFRAVPTVEMLRVCWEKTTSPYIRPFLKIPKINIRRKILLPRPPGSKYQRPITTYLYFSNSESELRQSTDLLLDYPGGGFISMTPEHHEERLRHWAIRTGKPVLAIDYGKGPEYPYPFGIEESFDIYRILVNSKGTAIGMSGTKLSIIMSGDSAGATMAINVVFKILEHNNSLHTPKSTKLPLPLALVFNYAFLDFNFTSWMTTAQKDHLQHISPTNLVGDRSLGYSRGKRLKRRKSWRDTLRGFTSGNEYEEEDDQVPPAMRHRHSTSTIKSARNSDRGRRDRSQTLPSKAADDKGDLADSESEDDESRHPSRSESPNLHRVRFASSTSPERTRNKSGTTLYRSASALEKRQSELSAAIAEANHRAVQSVVGRDVTRSEPIETRLTMTSRTAYFQDRVVSPSMMRAMAILYIGPHRNPDFATDYHLSPILAPSHLLAQLPPCLFQCGEKDPFVDDTIIFTGRIKDAKRARLAELNKLLASSNARHNAALKMSTISETPSSSVDARMADMKKERDRLEKETEDDWVKMVLFSDWSHGYLQMPSLMEESLSVIEEIADWIWDVFDKNSNGGVGSTEGESVVRAATSPFASETETDDMGITFVPKRPHSARREGSYSVDSTITDDTTMAEEEVVKSEEPSSIPAESEAVNSRPGIIKNGPRQTGQKITESELMRRRRLIDSNIFG